MRQVGLIYKGTGTIERAPQEGRHRKEQEWNQKKMLLALRQMVSTPTKGKSKEIRAF
jgi:hypothetical protein